MTVDAGKIVATINALFLNGYPSEECANMQDAPRIANESSLLIDIRAPF